MPIACLGPFPVGGSATGKFIADLFDGNPGSTARRQSDQDPPPA